MKNRLKRPPRMGREMFETRSSAWEAVGLNVPVNGDIVRRARRRLFVILPLLLAVVIAETYAGNHLTSRPKHPPVLIVGPATLSRSTLELIAVVLVLALGWIASRDVSRMAPALFRRMDPATAGTVEFLIRLAAVAITVVLALGVAGTSSQTIAIGGAFTAVVLGLAGQQTLGNLFAGIVLLSVRPFRVGERVRLQAGALGGPTEGVVSSLGLVYTTLSRGEDRIMVPNTQVLNAVVVPLHEPEAVDVRVRLPAGISPSHVQDLLDAGIRTPTRTAATVNLEEIGEEGVIVRIRAVPARHAHGAALADEMIMALQSVTAEHITGDAGR